MSVLFGRWDFGGVKVGPYVKWPVVSFTSILVYEVKMHLQTVFSQKATIQFHKHTTGSYTQLLCSKLCNERQRDQSNSTCTKAAHKMLMKLAQLELSTAQVLDELDVHTPERHELLQVDHRRRGHVEVK